MLSISSLRHASPQIDSDLEMLYDKVKLGCSRMQHPVSASPDVSALSASLQAFSASTPISARPKEGVLLSVARADECLGRLEVLPFPVGEFMPHLSPTNPVPNP